MKHFARILLLSLFFVGIICTFISCSLPQPEQHVSDQEHNKMDEEGVDSTRQQNPQESKEPTQTAPTQNEPVQRETSIHIMAVGDIMMHMPMVNAGKTKNGYHFASFFEEVKPFFEEADLVFGNLETTLAGAEAGYSGYPRFNSPDELADALAYAGFDIITTANNHSLDRGEKGIIRTIEQLERVGLKATGTFRTEEERRQILLVEKKGIKVATLAYTYGTNGIPIPSGKSYLVNLLDREQIQQDIQEAKEMGADLVVVAVHFGHEYQRQPSQAQKEWVQFLFDSGADIILGSHPHVLQPLEHRHWTTDTGDQREGIVIYSLGNFISNQREEPQDIGGILSIKVTKMTTTAQHMTSTKLTFDQVDFIPTWVHRFVAEGKRRYLIIPMAELLYGREYPALQEKDYQQLEKRHKEMLKHVFVE